MRSWPLVALLAAALAGVAVACSSSSLSAEDYQSSCTADSECVPATFGDVCATQCEPNGAIRRSEEARYTSDYQEKASGCDVNTYVADPCRNARKNIVARCVSGRCGLAEAPPADAGPDA